MNTDLESGRYVRKRLVNESVLVLMGIFNRILSSVGLDVGGDDEVEYQAAGDMRFPMVVVGETSEKSKELYGRDGDGDTGWNFLFDVSDPVKVSMMAVALRFETLRLNRVLEILDAERNRSDFTEWFNNRLNKADSVEDLFGRPLPLSENQRAAARDMEGVSLPITGYQPREVRTALYGDFYALGKTISEPELAEDYELENRRWFAGQEEIENLYFRIGAAEGKWYGVFDCGVEYDINIITDDPEIQNHLLGIHDCLLSVCIRTLEIMGEKEKYVEEWENITEAHPWMFVKLDSAQSVEETLRITPSQTVELDGEDYIIP